MACQGLGGKPGEMNVKERDATNGSVAVSFCRATITISHDHQHKS